MSFISQCSYIYTLSVIIIYSHVKLPTIAANLGPSRIASFLPSVLWFTRLYVALPPLPSVITDPHTTYSLCLSHWPDSQHWSENDPIKISPRTLWFRLLPPSPPPPTCIAHYIKTFNVKGIDNISYPKISKFLPQLLVSSFPFLIDSLVCTHLHISKPTPIYT